MREDLCTVHNYGGHNVRIWWLCMMKCQYGDELIWWWTCMVMTSYDEKNDGEVQSYVNTVVDYKAFEKSPENATDL